MRRHGATSSVERRALEMRLGGMAMGAVQSTGENPRLATDASRVIGARASLHPGVVFLLAAVASSGTNLLITGIYFYMAHRYQWGLRQNFFLATCQGGVYIVGALNAHGITSRLSPRRALALVYALMMATAAVCMLAHSAAVVMVLLLAYTIFSVISWPILESQITTGNDAHAMSRRISQYNIVWAATGGVMIAVDGTIIEHWPAGVFALPAIAHGLCLLIVLCLSAKSDDVRAETTEPAEHPPADLAASAEPDLRRVRTLALWLSRISLPATYVLIYGLMSLMPSLPALKELSATKQTLIGSVWMGGRWITFLALGLTNWWHSRPRILLAAAAAMVVAFLGVTIRPSDVLGHGSLATDLLSMAMWQLLLGVCMGVIYSCSLYFGMVLSEGSTEHGGYHEALVGLGQVLGPGAGAIALTLRPGSVYAGISAVGAVIVISTVAVFVASWVARRK